jgi:hypothetical protein
MAAMNSPILSGAMILMLSSVCSARFTPAAPPGISIRPAVEYGGTGHLPLSQTVPVTWPVSAYRTKQVWSSMRNVELDQIVFDAGASSKSLAGNEECFMAGRS